MNTTGYRIILFFLAAAFTGCRGSDEDQEILSPRSVSVVTARKKTITPTVSGYGTITVETKLDITAPVEGTVKEVHLAEGNRVRKGQPVITLENDQLLIRLRQAKAAVASAEAALVLTEAREREGLFRAERHILQIKQARILLDLEQAELEQLGKTLRNKEDLFDAGGLSEEAFTAVKMAFFKKESEYLHSELELYRNMIGCRDRDIIDAGFGFPETEGEKEHLIKLINTAVERAETQAARANLQNARAEGEAVEALVHRLVCTSTISGVIAGCSVYPGEEVERGDLLAAVIGVDTLIAPFEVTGKELPLLACGMEAEISLENVKDPRVKGEIIRMAPFIDPKSGSAAVKVRIENRDRTIKPGMYFTARVETGPPEETVILAGSALAGRSNTGRKGETAVVYTVRRERVFPLRIKVGEDFGDSVEISSGLEAGVVVVNYPPSDLKEGEPVVIEESDTEQVVYHRYHHTGGR